MDRLSSPGSEARITPVIADTELTAGEGLLHKSHVAAGAKFGKFGGVMMPMEYRAGGVLAEHQAVREQVGVFDVSHMGTLTIRGVGARAAINAILTNDLDRIGHGGVQYSLLCNASGGVIDDLLVYVRSPDDVFIVPNASNIAAVSSVVSQALPAGIELVDMSPATGIIAIQGPKSPDVLAALDFASDHAYDQAYLTFVDVATPYGDVVVARSGYTGEHGYELIVPGASAATWWRRTVAQVVAVGGRVCGLGARDTLRTEMGYPLHGHELSPTICAVGARVGWAIGWHKPAFAGREALLATRAAGVSRTLRGLRCIDKGIPRAHMEVRLVADADGTDADGDVRGVLTSGTLSPTLRQGIALAYLDSDIAVGSEVIIDIRGRDCRAEVVSPPFVDRDPHR